VLLEQAIVGLGYFLWIERLDMWADGCLELSFQPCFGHGHYLEAGHSALPCWLHETEEART
jgi:hypothetical protein